MNALIIYDNVSSGTTAVAALQHAAHRAELDAPLNIKPWRGCKKIFREKVSGSNRERPQFQRMLDQIRSSDTIVVWKLDRLARSTRDLLETMEAIREAGGKFQSLSEPWADTTTHAGKMIMTIFAGIAEFERDLIRERTSAGREAARKRGVQLSHHMSGTAANRSAVYSLMEKQSRRPSMKYPLLLRLKAFSRPLPSSQYVSFFGIRALLKDSCRNFLNADCLTW
jgi:DNA invertase Pin-like site-specific DNA recombinase